MSSETEVMQSISSMMNFIKTHVCNNLVEANNRNIISLERKDLEAISNLVNTSIESGFGLSMNDVVSTIQETTQKDSKADRSKRK